jgi:hypothetical protein
MLVHEPRLANYRILCLLVDHPLPCNLFSQMSGVLLLTHFVIKKIMLASLIIKVSLLEFIFTQKLRCSNIF